jgi:hypothetical protein
MAAVVALVGGCTSNSTSTGTTPGTGQTSTAAAPSPTTTQTTVAAPSPVPVNEEARDGAFGFTVGIVATDDSAFGINIDDEIHPQGVFVLVAMYVENIGGSEQTYSADYQRLLDSKGRLFSPDLRARPEYTEVDINPGNSTPAYLYFDVPHGTTPSQYVLLLHASPDSPGVTVRLPDSYRSPTLPPTTTSR